MLRDDAPETDEGGAAELTPVLLLILRLRRGTVEVGGGIGGDGMIGGRGDVAMVGSGEGVLEDEAVMDGGGSSSWDGGGGGRYACEDGAEGGVGGGGCRAGDVGGNGLFC